MGGVLNGFPQLRVRTEFSFRRAFGKVTAVAQRLAQMRCDAAAMVDDDSAWGHEQWGRACAAVGVEPLFGAAMPVPQPDGRTPMAWALAETSAAGLYEFVSMGLERDWSAAPQNVVRFAGSALADPEQFDYIDLNPSSRLAGHASLRLARATGKPLVLTSRNDWPGPEDRLDALAFNDRRRVMAPQHLCAPAELRRAMPWVPERDWRNAARNTRELAERCSGVKLLTAPLIHVPGDLAAEVEAGRKYRLAAGHIANWTPAYQQRLEHELGMIRLKDYESYFLVVGDLVRWAKQRMLVGPARGSSAGSLVCYLLRITEIDPLVHELLFERFIDVSRNDLPDIDIDFQDSARDQVFAYLAQRYGQANVARLGNISTMKPRSVLAECGKRLGIPEVATRGVRNVLIEYSSGDSRYGAALEDTLRTTEPGQQFTAAYPEHKYLLTSEGHAHHTSVHAAAAIICNVPLTNFCVVRNGICEVDKESATRLGLLKIDALGLRTLGVIADSHCVTGDQLYGLPLTDQAVFDVINDGKFAGVFQFEGAAQRRVAKQIPVTDFKQLDHITALARPGPLGGGATNSYINRFHGRMPIEYRHPTMANYLGETNGVVLYQEQVMRIAREIGDFSWEVVAEIRKAMSGRKGVEYFNRRGAEFLAGAQQLHGMQPPEAQSIWDEICTFGAWGMNKSHTVSYSVISYWCAWMKAYHGLEYAAALLRNAQSDEQSMELLRELVAEGIEVAAFDPDLSGIDWDVQAGKLIGGWINIHGVGPAKARQILNRRAAGKSTAKDVELAQHGRVKFANLWPLRTAYAKLYADPSARNVRQPIKEFDALEDEENAVVIGQLVRAERRDQNEAVRLARRDGKRYQGQPLFLDSFMVDDSISKPVLVRFKTALWARYGRRIADRAVPGDVFLLRGRWLANFSMLLATKALCLTNEQLFK